MEKIRYSVHLAKPKYHHLYTSELKFDPPTKANLDETHTYATTSDGDDVMSDPREDAVELFNAGHEHEFGRGRDKRGFTYGDILQEPNGTCWQWRIDGWHELE